MYYIIKVQYFAKPQNFILIMFKVRNFLLLAFLLAVTVAFTWYSFRRNNYDSNQVENGVDISAPFYETEATAPYGEHSEPGTTEPKENEIHGGNDSTHNLLDSSLNEGIRRTEPENVHDQGHGKQNNGH